MTILEDLEQRIRERKVRVDERLEILRALLQDADGPVGERTLDEKQAALLDALKKASDRLKGTAG